MKIVHEKGTNYITFFPKGKFFSKISTFLRLGGFKLNIDDNDYEIVRGRFKKKIKTFIPSMLNNKVQDVIFIYKFGTKHSHTYINNKGFTKHRQGFRYANVFFNHIKNKEDKLTKENLIKYAAKYLIDNWFAFQISFSDESEPWPLHSISFKFI